MSSAIESARAREREVGLKKKNRTTEKRTERTTKTIRRRVCVSQQESSRARCLNTELDKKESRQNPDTRGSDHHRNARAARIVLVVLSSRARARESEIRQTDGCDAKKKPKQNRDRSDPIRPHLHRFNERVDASGRGLAREQRRGEVHHPLPPRPGPGVARVPVFPLGLKRRGDAAAGFLRGFPRALRVVPYERMSGWSSKASGGVERRPGRVLKARDGRRETPGKGLKEWRSPRRCGRMGTSV
jgi:hypothetical protein